jgi:hypothetical protein
MSAPAVPAPLDTVAYCSTCQDAVGRPVVTQYFGDRCGCCGRQWGHDSDRRDCTAKHVEGAVWWQLLDKEQGIRPNEEPT